MNFSLVEFRRVKEAQRAKEGLQGKLVNDSRITIEYSSDENRPMLPYATRISPRQHYSAYDYIWHSIIAKNEISVCRVIYVPIVEAGAGLEKLTKHYADAAVGFTIGYFLPDTDKGFASYADFLRYLSSRDRVGVGDLVHDRTNMYLVPPSDFIRKVLKVDDPPYLYGVVLKSAPSGTPESYQPRATELTASQIAQARLLLAFDIIESLSNLQPSGTMEGTAGASAGMLASDVTVAPSLGDMLIGSFSSEDIKMLG